MAKINIYVPDRLFEKMEEKREQVKWSKVAQQAFEQQLHLLGNENKRKEESMIERLKTQKSESESRRENADDGFSAGAKWAEEHASWDELRALERVSKEPNELMPQTSFGEVDYRAPLAQAICSYIDAMDETESEDRMPDLCEEMYGDTLHRNKSRKYIYGFMAGAMDRWNAVKSKV